MFAKGILTKTLFTLLMSSAGGASSIKEDSGTIIGCNPPKDSLSKGFEVSYYHYPQKRDQSNGCYDYDPRYTSEEYLYGGYEDFGGGLIGKSSGVTNLTFISSLQRKGCQIPLLGKLPPNFNFDEEFHLTNFSMLMTGYFLAEKTGEYKFNLDYNDDLAYMNVGAGKASF